MTSITSDQIVAVQINHIHIPQLKPPAPNTSTPYMIRRIPQIRPPFRLPASVPSIWVRYHSHGHGHNHSHGPNMLMGRGGLHNPGVRITWIGLLTNLGMTVGKGIGGVVFHSQSLLADAVHALSDLVSDFLTLATVSVARKPPSEYFPNGYGRIEAIGAFGVSALLVMAGISTGWSSLLACGELLLGHGSPVIEIMSKVPIPGHSHAGEGQIAEWNAMYIALGSIFIKEALFQATYKIGKQQNSQVLIANAWHHRVDCLASGVSVASITAGRLLGLVWLDPLGGLIISIMILRAGWGPLKESAKELAGDIEPAMNSETTQELRQQAVTGLKALDPNWKVANVTVEPYGSTYVAMVSITPEHETVTAPIDLEAVRHLREDLLHIKYVKQVYIVLADGSPAILPGHASNSEHGGPADHHIDSHDHPHTHTETHSKQ